MYYNANMSKIVFHYTDKELIVYWVQAYTLYGQIIAAQLIST
jgi:hypothetical protein